jgi:DNA polymerase-1
MTTLVAIDESQVEMRCAAHESQDAYMLKLFRDGADIHTMTASKVYGKPPEEIDDKKERYPMKRAGFGVLYKITGAGLLDVFYHEGITSYSESDCDHFSNEWYGVFPGVRKRQDSVRGFAIRNGYVADMFGRRRWIPEVASALPFVKEAGIRQAINCPIQSLAQQIIKECMRQLMPRVREWQAAGFTLLPLLQIHDELLFEMDEEIVEAVVPQFSEIMVHAVELSVPVKVDAEVGHSWLDMVGFDKWMEERRG